MVLAARLRTRAVVGLSCRVRGRFGIDLVSRCEISAGSGELSSSQVYIYMAKMLRLLPFHLFTSACSIQKINKC
jgi:hypothetical protein